MDWKVVAGPGATLDDDSIDIDVDVPSAGESVRHVSRSSIQAVNSPFPNHRVCK